MKFNRSFILIFLLFALPVVIALITINSFSLNKIRHQFEVGNELQNKNIEALIETAQISEQVSTVHLSVTNSLNAAISGKMSNVKIFRVHANAVNSLNKLTARILQLSRSIQIQEASPQDGQLLLDHFNQYKNLIIQTTDISSIDPKSASHFVDLAENHFNDFTEHSHHISAFLAARARLLNMEGNQLFNAAFQKMALITLLGMIAILLLAAFTALRVRKLARS